MITPRFTCSQTAESVVVSIYCPSVRASDVEIHVDETLFTVHINPYFLRLNFSNALLEDDGSSAQYDPGTGYLTVTLTKEVKGQDFKDLDLLAKLLAPRPTTQQPLIEVLATENSIQREEEQLIARTQGLSLEHQEILAAAQNDWQLPQEAPESLPPLNISAEKRYGFLDMHSGYFKHMTHTENEVNELGSVVETCPVDERRQRRTKHEEEKWDEEHYMADYADDECIRELLAWRHPYITDTNAFQYTEEENLVMLQLPRKEYLPTPVQIHNLYLTLITFLFSYAYEARATQRDPTPESAWTLSSLIPAFSALDPPPYSPTHHCPSTTSLDPFDFSSAELSATLIPSYRRSLAFPLYRSFALAEACRTDVGELLSKGKRTVVRCLLEMKYILDHHEVYYVYSKIWLDDFSMWTQAHASDEVLVALGKELKRVNMKKNSIGWDLEELEEATQEVQEREGDSDDESGDDFDVPAPLESSAGDIENNYLH